MSENSETDFLENLNRQIGEAELNRDEEFLRRTLADDLIFRRANGEVVNKDKYLTELMNPKNTYEYLIAEDVQAEVFEETATVSLLVRAKGKREKGDAIVDFEGVFRNLRIFYKREGEWQCVVWFNSRVE